MTRAQHAILVPCAHCGAERGRPCAKRREPHQVRVRMWQQVGCPGPAQMPKGRPTPKRREAEKRNRGPILRRGGW